MKNSTATYEDGIDVRLLPIPYSNTALYWHLKNNVFGLSEKAIEGILGNIHKVNCGHWGIDYIDPIVGISAREMCDDLKIEYNEEAAHY